MIWTLLVSFSISVSNLCHGTLPFCDLSCSWQTLHQWHSVAFSFQAQHETSWTVLLRLQFISEPAERHQAIAELPILLSLEASASLSLMCTHVLHVFFPKNPPGCYFFLNISSLYIIVCTKYQWLSNNSALHRSLLPFRFLHLSKRTTYFSWSTPESQDGYMPSLGHACCSGEIVSKYTDHSWDSCPYIHFPDNRS